MRGRLGLPTGGHGTGKRQRPPASSDCPAPSVRRLKSSAVDRLGELGTDRTRDLALLTLQPSPACPTPAPRGSDLARVAKLVEHEANRRVADAGERSLDVPGAGTDRTRCS